ncbi:hypothetical protein MJD09_03980 [bacterium]|nr:hypothetical protein [bacterium]
MRIKGIFTKRYLAAGGKDGPRNESRQRKGEAAVWQRRFWEHLIHDEEDYIHYNPVKHGYVEKPQEWKWSSFHRYLKLGHYPDDWGVGEPVLEVNSDFGE